MNTFCHWLIGTPWYLMLLMLVMGQLFAVMSGEIEGRLFDRPPSPRQNNMKDIHIELILFRGTFWVSATTAVGPLLVLGLILLFPWTHDGAYYSRRNDIHPIKYTRRWSEEPSSTSTAKWSFSYTTRRILAAIGLSLIIAAICLSIRYA